MNEDKEALLKLEYEQLCNDWRHRDSMLWSVLAMIITVTGVLFYVIEKKLPLFLNYASYLVVLLFYIAALVKITKDHYYQIGSVELMRQIFPKYCLEIKGCFRQNCPSKHYFDYNKDKGEIPCNYIYRKIYNQSTYNLFYLISIFLIVGVASLLLFELCLEVYFYFNYQPSKLII